MDKCPHINQEYIPPEENTNVVKNLICLDCGANLPMDEDIKYYG